MRTLRSALILAVFMSCTSTPDGAQSSVLPTVETAPVPSGGDAADDMVVWVHPTDRSLSTVIGTDKDAGILVYDLAGKVLQFLPDGRLNNVDLRHDFPLAEGPLRASPGGKSPGPSRLGVDLVTSLERNGNVLAIYVVDPNTRLLRSVAARTITLGISGYGSCMYRSPLTDITFVFVTSEQGEVEQWKLFDDGNGRVDAVLVRAFDVGAQTEGCVADDEHATLYVGEESKGIWSYGAEPDAGPARVLVDHTGAGGHLTPDVEGLAIYYAGGGAGYLLASSQGNNTYTVYDRRPPHTFRLSFQIADNPVLGIDAVSDTDGIDVMNLGLGSGFPEGVFLAQDGSNQGGNQNFKLVPWAAIANSANPPLIVDPIYETN